MVFRCVLCMARLPRCSAPLVFPLAMFPLPKIEDASSRAEGMRSSREPFQGFSELPPLARRRCAGRKRPVRVPRPSASNMQVVRLASVSLVLIAAHVVAVCGQVLSMAWALCVALRACVRRVGPHFGCGGSDL